MSLADDLTTPVEGDEDKTPYSERGPAEVSNDSDGIFGQSGGSTVVATELSGDRASSQVTIGVERA